MSIIEILKKWNPWEKEIQQGIVRERYLSKIYPFVERKEIIVLKGIRRCGKSTILKQLMVKLIAEGIKKEQILYLNLEDYGFSERLSVNLFSEVLESYKTYAKNSDRIYFFIDEIQKIPSWEKWIRTAYDLNEPIKFFITGSCASLLSKELSTLLTGRNISFTILPLSFQECIEFTRTENVDEYLRFGGFPEVVLENSEEKKEALLRQYFEDIVQKDIVDRYAVRNTQQIFALAQYLVSASGTKVSVNKLSRVFGIAKDTLQTYLNYLIDAYLLIEVRYFSYSAKVKYDVSKLPKVYCIDLGFVNILHSGMSKNTGQLFENAVLIKLIEKEIEVQYWSSNTTEVDFVTGNTALNVTSGTVIPEREKKGLSEFCKKHKGFEEIIVTSTVAQKGLVSLYEFLLS